MEFAHRFTFPSVESQLMIKNTNDGRLGHPTLLLQTWESSHSSKIYPSHFQLTRVYRPLPPLKIIVEADKLIH